MYAVMHGHTLSPQTNATKAVIDDSVRMHSGSNHMKQICVITNKRSSFQRLEGAFTFFTMLIHIVTQRGNQA